MRCYYESFKMYFKKYNKIPWRSQNIYSGNHFLATYTCTCPFGTLVVLRPTRNPDMTYMGPLYIYGILIKNAECGFWQLFLDRDQITRNYFLFQRNVSRHAICPRSGGHCLT